MGTYIFTVFVLAYPEIRWVLSEKRRYAKYEDELTSKVP